MLKLLLIFSLLKFLLIFSLLKFFNILFKLTDVQPSFMALALNELVLVTTLWLVLFLVGVILLCRRLWNVLLWVFWRFERVIFSRLVFFITMSPSFNLILFTLVVYIYDRIVIIIIPKLTLLLIDQPLLMSTHFCHFCYFLHQVFS